MIQLSLTTEEGAPVFPFIAPGVLSSQITQGRVGHYFKSSIPGFGLVNWQLVSFTPPAWGADLGSGTVSMNIINPDGTMSFTQVSNQDIVGLQYIGPQLPPPPPVTPVTPTPVTPPPRPSWCASYPFHPACWRAEGPFQYYRGYDTYWIPVHFPKN